MTLRKRYLFFFSLALTVYLLIPVFMMETVISADKLQYQPDHFDGLRYFNPNVPQAPPYHPGQASRRGVSWWVWKWILNDDLNILIDPIWSDRCSPVSWAGPKRHLQPGIRFEDLPLIDVVLVSHNHYDHLDLPTLERS
jgi:hypothetical protein